MRLTVLASGSSGNGYLLEARHSALLLECGVKPEAMMRRISMPVSRIAGALITHEHGDHAGYAHRYAALGIPIYASEGTMKAVRLSGAHPLRAMQVAYVDEWKVMPFDIRHDAAEPLGFIIEHDECGRILFVTDTKLVPYDFRMLHLDHIMVEANYDDALLDDNVANGRIDASRAARTRPGWRSAVESWSRRISLPLSRDSIVLFSRRICVSLLCRAVTSAIRTMRNTASSTVTTTASASCRMPLDERTGIGALVPAMTERRLPEAASSPLAQLWTCGEAGDGIPPRCPAANGAFR